MPELSTLNSESIIILEEKCSLKLTLLPGQTLFHELSILNREELELNVKEDVLNFVVDELTAEMRIDIVTANSEVLVGRVLQEVYVVKTTSITYGICIEVFLLFSKIGSWLRLRTVDVHVEHNCSRLDKNLFNLKIIFIYF